jgi:hypothetical protein
MFLRHGEAAMRASDADLRQGMRNLIFWTIAIAAVLTLAVAFRPRASVSRTVRLSDARHPGAALIATSSRQDAFSTLDPKEMAQGCLNCPISSYLGSPRTSP